MLASSSLVSFLRCIFAWAKHTFKITLCQSDHGFEMSGNYAETTVLTGVLSQLDVGLFDYFICFDAEDRLNVESGIFDVLFDELLGFFEYGAVFFLGKVVDVRTFEFRSVRMVYQMLVYHKIC